MRTKAELTLLYNKITAITYDIEDNFEAVDELKLIHLLEETAKTLTEIIEN